MKALLFIFLVIYGVNWAQAAPSCKSLFNEENLKKNKSKVISTESNTSNFEDRFKNFESLRNRIEELVTKTTIAKIVKIKAPELRGDLAKQIEFLKEAQRDNQYKNSFIKNFIGIHISKLEFAIKNEFNLEDHFRLSLKTVVLLDQKTEESTGAWKLTQLQNERLGKFIRNEISDELFFKSFPKVREFLFEWKKSLFSNRILLFSTLEMDIPKFNRFLSPTISFLGLINHKANPDSNGVTGPLGYASHDLNHHLMYLSQKKNWSYISLKPDQQRQLRIKIRQNYLIARENLSPESQMSLDILFFQTFHEDTLIFPNFIFSIQRDMQYNEEPVLDDSNILNYNELHGLKLSSKSVFPQQVGQSSIKSFLDDNTHPSKLYSDVYPTWKILSEIWVKAYIEIMKW